MKLRISDNSIRLRLLRSEVTDLLEKGHLSETIYFGPGEQPSLIYGLEHKPGLDDIQVRHNPSEVIIVLPTQQARLWAETDETGIYSTVDLGRNGSLKIVVEKDFACLDLTDADNHDTFPNPQIKTAC